MDCNEEVTSYSSDDKYSASSLKTTKLIYSTLSLYLFRGFEWRGPIFAVGPIFVITGVLNIDQLERRKYDQISICVCKWPICMMMMMFT
jgi:hypothetical protein